MLRAAATCRDTVIAPGRLPVGRRQLGEGSVQAASCCASSLSLFINALTRLTSGANSV